MSPEAATTVTWRLAAAWSAAFTLLTCARLTQCSPPICPAALIDMTPPSVLPRRSEATAAETALLVLSRDVDGTRRMTRVASGASTCTISASSTSSPKASQGEPAPASVVTTRIRAAGRWNMLSKAAMSWRMSVTRGGLSRDSASSGSTTVSPRPLIPRPRSGSMP